MSVSRLRRIDLREVRKDEAADFTPWLQNNLDMLGEELGMKLSAVERNTEVGAFEADIVAEDAEGSSVVIENQFGRSDHDHLGKLLTYATNLEARTAIWVCEEPRPEHAKAVTWLNQSVSGSSFYLAKLDVFRIGESPPAPHFTLIAGPSDE